MPQNRMATRKPINRQELHKPTTNLVAHFQELCDHPWASDSRRNTIVLTGCLDFSNETNFVSKQFCNTIQMGSFCLYLFLVQNFVRILSRSDSSEHCYHPPIKKF
jgi:hypothetical protein